MESVHSDIFIGTSTVKISKARGVFTFDAMFLAVVRRYDVAPDEATLKAAAGDFFGALCFLQSGVLPRRGDPDLQSLAIGKYVTVDDAARGAAEKRRCWIPILSISSPIPCSAGGSDLAPRVARGTGTLRQLFRGKRP